MALIKRLFKAIGKIVTAPFMGYVWMARCKNLLVENARLSTRTTELTAQVSNIQTSNNAKDEELRARMKRIVFLANQTDQLKKQYGVQEEAAMQMMYERNAIHGYALDLDAQLSELTMFCEDLDTAFNALGTDYEGEVNRSVRAAQSAITTISALPCASRISKDHWKLVQAAINAIPIRFTAPDAQEQNEPTDPIVQA